jgi:hypothetical protein
VHFTYLLHLVGPHFIIQVALSLIDHMQGHLLKIDLMEDALAFLKEYPRTLT